MLNMRFLFDLGKKQDLTPVTGEVKSIRFDGYSLFYRCAKSKCRIIMFSQLELRLIKSTLKSRIEKETTELKQLDEDSDEYMEKANDLMVLDALVFKIDNSQH